MPTQRKYDLLMPASMTSEGLDAHLPHGIKEIIAISAYLKNHFYYEHIPHGEIGLENITELFLSKELEIDLPSMKLEVHYDALENSHYSKKFDVLFLELGGVNCTSQEGLIQVLSGSFEFKNLK